MIDFFKQRKIVIIIGILVIILIGWKMYDSSNFDEVNSEEILVSNTKDDKSKNEEEEDVMAVHVTGEVKKPGVVKVKEGSRIEDIIEAAGGLTENADISNVNLAFAVEDGMKIRIPSQDDEETEEEYITEDSGKGIILSEEESSSSSSVININTATQTELEELPGIGPSISTRIIEYREQNGKFKDIEDIKTKKDKLQEKAMALATKVYENIQKEQQANQNNENQTTEEKKDDVADASYEEK